MPRVLFIFLIFYSVIGKCGVISQPAWSKTDIRVCFASDKNVSQTCLLDYSTADQNGIMGSEIPSKNIRMMVRDWVNNEYSQARTGVHFTGWRTCEENPSADAYLFIK